LCKYALSIQNFSVLYCAAVLICGRTGIACLSVRKTRRKPTSTQQFSRAEDNYVLILGETVKGQGYSCH